MEYDGILTNWEMTNISGFNIIYGTMYGDKKMRFADGDRVRTSYVTEIKEVDGAKFAITRNSVYKLEEPLREE